MPSVRAAHRLTRPHQRCRKKKTKPQLPKHGVHLHRCVVCNGPADYGNFGVCRNCSKNSWTVVYDREHAYGRIPVNLVKQYGLKKNSRNSLRSTSST